VIVTFHLLTRSECNSEYTRRNYMKRGKVEKGLYIRTCWERLLRKKIENWV